MEQLELNDKIFKINEEGFLPFAIEVFRFQYDNNKVFRDFSNALGYRSKEIHTLTDLPFLPINFFKTSSVKSGHFEPQAVFESSGTTGMVNSRHFIRDLSVYEKSFLNGFELFYGPVQEYCILGLLPAYLERKHSSLIYMVNRMIRESCHPLSGFYLNEFDMLSATIKKLEEEKQKTILIGVTFALLDFAEKTSAENRVMNLKHTLIMETGGMKGRREEMIREEVHEILKKTFGVPAIHSEYGMTELLAQAYSKRDGIFQCPPWMKVMIRDEEDPSQVNRMGKGLINIIDLANRYSCSFIATDDVGKVYEDGSFEVLGRRDNSDLRGCSLLIA